MSSHELQATNDPLAQRVADEQLRAHFAQIPAMAIAPSLGGLFSAWVLWDAVDNRYLIYGVSAVIALSLARLLLWRQFCRLPPGRDAAPRWRVLALAAALLSGCVWGSAAPLLYPPLVPDHQVFLLVLLTLLPVVPIAALAVYMPAFYAYFIPCVAPFIVTLALHDSRPERMAALLLAMMMVAMMTFARLYSQRFAEAIRLRLQLADRSAALQAAVLHKSRFIAAASHDLRQPVHAMGLFLASMQQSAARPDDARMLGLLDRSLRNLRSMLTNMLDVARLDAAAVKPRLRCFDVAAMLFKLRDEFEPLAERKRLQLRCRAPALVVRSDAALLERMLRNLLANALNYTRQGGVSLVALPRADEVLLQVRDTGIGIASDQVDHVFQDYGRVRDVDDGDAGGLGLGLAIVRRLAALLGHRLQLRSKPGRGTVITLALRREQVADFVDRADPPSVDCAMPAALVMVIDDDPAVLASMAALMHRWGHRTLTCVSVAQALAELARCARPPAVLVIDYWLGDGQTGPSAVAALQPRLGDAVPVILVTADTSPERVRQSLQAGYWLLHKPVDPQQLRVCMAQALASHRADAENLV